MKKITIIYSKFVMGGAEKVLIRMLEKIDASKYDINVIFTKPGGELESKIPKHIKIQHCKVNTLGNHLRNLEIINFIKGLYFRVRIRVAKTYEDKSYWTSKVYILPDCVSEECVICYTHFNFLSICLAAQTNAKKKALWVHSFFRENYDKKLYSKFLNKFDKIFFVSLATKSEFEKNFPLHKEKTEVFYNLVDVDRIRREACLSIQMNIKHFAITTVGRLDLLKGQQLVPEIVRKLLDSGYEVFWYLIGNGDIKQLILDEINKYQVVENVILLGEMQNPLPYIKNSDLFVLPTFLEGYCTTTNEARILAKPVVTTDIPSMHEQFVSGENGLIVEATVDGLYNGIKKMLDNPKLMEHFSKKLSQSNFRNDAEINKLYNWINK